MDCAQRSRVDTGLWATWPNVSTEQIRRLRDEACDLTRSGVHPNDHQKAERIENQAANAATIAQAATEAKSAPRTLATNGCARWS